MSERSVLQPGHKKLTRAWGDQQAQAMWNGTFSFFDVPWRGATTLDFGCAWGYFEKLLVERQGVERAVGVDICAHWERMIDWTPAETPGVELHVGDIREIPALTGRQYDVMLTSGTFMLLTPSDLQSVLRWMFAHLRPGGHAVFRTRTFTSWVGADLHETVHQTPLPHLLFSKRTIDDFLRERNLETSRYMSPLTAASYLMLYKRVGFDILDARRSTNKFTPEQLAPYSDKLAAFDPLELKTADLFAHLRKPEVPLDLDLLESADVRS